MKTKLIAVWHVEYFVGRRGVPRVAIALSYGHAELLAGAFRTHDRAECVTITGPHQHRVPT